MPVMQMRKMNANRVMATFNTARFACALSVDLRLLALPNA